VFVNSTVDPIATDAQHDQNLRALATKIHGITPIIAHLTVASWAHRLQPDPTHATQNVPDNLGAAGMLATLAAVRATFEPAQPEPEPIEDPMFSKLIDASKELLVVKDVKPIADQPGWFTLIRPDDLVWSQQPDGTIGTRPAGTEGEWERCCRSGNAATFKVDGVYYTRSFVEVAA